MQCQSARPQYVPILVMLVSLRCVLRICQWWPALSFVCSTFSNTAQHELCACQHLGHAPQKFCHACLRGHSCIAGHPPLACLALPRPCVAASSAWGAPPALHRSSIQLEVLQEIRLLELVHLHHPHQRPRPGAERCWSMHQVIALYTGNLKDGLESKSKAPGSTASATHTGTNSHSSSIM
jgi:hypothetical protein